jgi:hypothetical protein
VSVRAMIVDAHDRRREATRLAELQLQRAPDVRRGRCHVHASTRATVRAGTRTSATFRGRAIRQGGRGSSEPRQDGVSWR